MITNPDRAQIEALGESMAMNAREAALQRRIEELKGTVDNLECDVAYWKDNASNAVAAEREAIASWADRECTPTVANCIRARGHG